ncbi:MAG: hypothetical protein LBT65_05570 [Synergistaceae bacterium]|nr:hypothetical protein [Synergistaceae bacterium]
MEVLSDRYFRFLFLVKSAGRRFACSGNFFDRINSRSNFAMPDNVMRPRFFPFGFIISANFSQGTHPSENVFFQYVGNFKKSMAFIINFIP